MVLKKAAANIKTGSNMVIASVRDVNHIMANTFYDINTILSVNVTSYVTYTMDGVPHLSYILMILCYQLITFIIDIISVTIL